MDKELPGLSLFFTYERQHPQTLASPGSVDCNSPSKAKKHAPPPPTPLPPPRSPRGSLSRGGGAVTENKPEIRRQNGYEDSVSLDKSNTGARPPISGKETAVDPRCAGGLTTQADQI